MNSAEIERIRALVDEPRRPSFTTGEMREVLAALSEATARADRWNKTSLETANELARALGPYRDVDEAVAAHGRVRKLTEALKVADPESYYRITREALAGVASVERSNP